jgi:serine/threonine-protein kinase
MLSWGDTAARSTGLRLPTVRLDLRHCAERSEISDVHPVRTISGPGKEEGEVTVLSRRYELRNKLGEGGMGIVYSAWDERLERTVAIKLLRPFVADEPDQRRRFDREARTLAALSNDHIVRVYDYAESDDAAYLVMEYVAGQNLQQATAGRLPLEWKEVRQYATPVCEALAYAHGKGVIHRDLTPANILIEQATGRVVATDFGLARIARSANTITATGVLIGTPEFWSPEQAMGRDNDASTDMYALGCILFQLLTGHLPFEGGDRLAIGLRRAHEDAPSLVDRVRNAPPDAVALVDSLLSRDGANRPSALQANTMIARGVAANESRKSQKAVRPSPSLIPVDEAPTELLPDAMPTEVAPENQRTPVQTRPPPAAPHRRRTTALLVFGVLACGVVVVVAVAERSDQGSSAATTTQTVGHKHVASPSIMPNVVGTTLAAARRTITSSTSKTMIFDVSRRYSTAQRIGMVVSQLPRPRSHLGRTAFLMVSNGPPTAPVPSITAGSSSDTARARLNRVGFASHVRFTPSWNVRKNTVISLNPASGTIAKRPGNLTIYVSSGYPRTVVPDVRSIYIAPAESQLAAKHLHYHLAYAPSQKWAPNQVLKQSPAAGAIMIQGGTVSLTISREPKWVSVFSDYGSDAYQSPPFTVSGTWRIKYRVDTTSQYAIVLTTFTWAGGYFSANTPGELHIYNAYGAGTYTMKVEPIEPDSTWYFAIEDLE